MFKKYTSSTATFPFSASSSVHSETHFCILKGEAVFVLVYEMLEMQLAGKVQTRLPCRKAHSCSLPH